MSHPRLPMFPTDTPINKTNTATPTIEDRIAKLENLTGNHSIALLDVISQQQRFENTIAGLKNIIAGQEKIIKQQQETITLQKEIIADPQKLQAERDAHAAFEKQLSDEENQSKAAQIEYKIDDNSDEVKLRARIISLIPKDVKNQNPRAIITYFCKHLLGVDVKFSHEVDKGTKADEHPKFTTRVIINNTELATATNPYKHLAREEAEKNAISHLNSDDGFIFVNQLIDDLFKRKKATLQGNESAQSNPDSIMPSPDKYEKRSRIVSLIPSSDVSNPTAAIINFGRHHLGLNVEFPYEEKVATTTVKVVVNNTVLATVSDKRKRVAREKVARNAIDYLNSPDGIKFLIPLIDAMQALQVNESAQSNSVLPSTQSVQQEQPTPFVSVPSVSLKNFSLYPASPANQASDAASQKPGTYYPSV